MADKNLFACSVVTPERAVLETSARFVAFPAYDGEMGVLRHRSPMVCRMGIGVLRIESPGEAHRLFVDGGFAQVFGDEMTILTEQAIEADKVTREDADQAMVEARAMTGSDDVAVYGQTRGDAACPHQAAPIEVGPVADSCPTGLDSGIALHYIPRESRSPGTPVVRIGAATPGIGG